MSKTISVIIGVVVIAAGIWLFAGDGGGTVETAPTSTAATSAEESNDATDATSSVDGLVYNPERAQDLIRVETPQVGESVSSPLTFSGEARGVWFFEDNASAKLLNSEGEKIAQTAFQTETGNWMTEEFVAFSGEIEFDGASVQTPTGTLVIDRANPSGLAENDMSVEIPVQF